MDAIRDDKRYTYADYASWDDDARYELIDGIAYMMSPAPGRRHQGIGGNIFAHLWNFLRGKPCKVYDAPFDVRLNAADDDDTVVQPDIVVVCDQAKLDDKGCNGAPDLVVEILSPSTASRDRVLKFNKYLQAGVREYWIVDPDSKTVLTHMLKDGQYMTRAYAEADTVPVHVLDGCTISLPDVFAE